jgi:N-acyl-D-aspartate/D-glutamate deacylase
MFEEFPSGEAMRHLARNLHERDEIISDPKFREEFKADMNKQFGPKVWDRDLKMTTILECPDESLIGKNFMDIASERQGSPSDVFLDLIVKFDKKIKWTTTIANDRPENFYHLYNYKYNQMSFSDAGAHLVNMAFYDITIQMITNVYDSIERGNPIMSMEKCIWRLTAEQADWFGVDCGHVEEGKIADLVIIDPEALKNVKKDTVAKGIIEEFDNFERLVNRNENVVYKVIVGGEVIFENEDFVTGYGKNKKYGRLLKSTVVV